MQNVAVPSGCGDLLDGTFPDASQHKGEEKREINCNPISGQLFTSNLILMSSGLLFTGGG